ncbi:MAG: tetratricopeptide repeat protein [Elusimicrobia bacterium]|nr:tetratricopeptide repeat protein [Elusimicrobiota bacterium]
MESTSPSPQARLPPWGAFAWILAAVWVFGLLAWAPFVYDDRAYLLDNPLITGPWPGLPAFIARSFSETREYLPLPVLLHRLLYLAAGEEVAPYRLTSLLLHGFNCFLALRLFRRLLGHGAASLWAAVLFSLFPPHVEVLAQSTFKKHLLVAFFGLLLLEVEALRPRRRWAPYAAAGLLGLAVLCKESALLLPCLAFLCAALEGGPGRTWREAKGTWLALAGVSAAFALARLWVAPQAYELPSQGGLKLLTAAKMLLWYAGKLLVPAPLCLERDLLPVASGLLELAGLGAALAVTGAGLWRVARADRIIAAGLLWSLVSLLPFLDLVPYLNVSLVADRYLYLPSLGFFLSAARAAQLAVGKAFWRGRTLRLAAALVATAYGAYAMRYASRFSTAMDLWSETAGCAPANPRARSALGTELLREHRFPEALAELETAARLAPGYAPTFQSLPAAYLALGRVGEALEAARRLVRLEPDADSWLVLGSYEWRAGGPANAVASLRRAFELAPDWPNAALNLGACYLELGRLGEAEAAFVHAARLSPSRARALAGLGALAQRRGDLSRAAALYRESLALAPFQRAAARELARAEVRLGHPQRAREAYAPLLSAARRKSPGGLLLRELDAELGRILATAR